MLRGAIKPSIDEPVPGVSEDVIDLSYQSFGSQWHTRAHSCTLTLRRAGKVEVFSAAISAETRKDTEGAQSTLEQGIFAAEAENADLA